jgi:hypothetical protein
MAGQTSTIVAVTRGECSSFAELLLRLYGGVHAASP